MFRFKTINNNGKLFYAIFHTGVKSALGKFISALCHSETHEVIKTRTCRERTLMFQTDALTKQSILILGELGPAQFIQEYSEDHSQ